MPVDSILPTIARLGPLVRHVLRWVLMLAVTGASIVLAVWLILQWGILPRVDRWKPHIERWASASLGTQVRIERVETSGSLWAPVVTLHRVRLSGATGREDLRLDEVRAMFVPSSLLPRALTHWEPRFEQLWINAPAIEVRRDPAGRWWAAGIDLGTPGQDGGGHAADWLFRQREVAVRGGALTWTDELRHAAPLTLTRVDIVLRNAFARHRWRIDATPPPEVGEPFTLVGDFRQSLLAVAGLQRPGDWRRWRGQLFARTPWVDAQALARHVEVPAGLLRASVAAQAWVELDRGELTGLTLQLGARDVTLQWQAGPPSLTFDTLGTRLEVVRRPAGTFRRNEQVRFAVQDLHFDMADGLHWPGATMALEWERSPEGVLQGGSFESSTLELETLARLTAHARLAPPLRQLLQDMRPRGRLAHARARWQGPPDAPSSYWVAGQADDLWLAGATAPAVLDHHTLPRRPGVRNAGLDFEFTERGGRAVVSMQDGAIELPGVFEDPLVPFSQLSGELRWRIDRTSAQRSRGAAALPDLEVEWRDVRFANADAQGQVQGRWNTGTGPAGSRTAAPGNRLPGYLELDAQIDTAQAPRVHRYLPVALPESVRHYVRDAVRSGLVEDITARVRGSLLAFPYARAGSGEFSLNARVRDSEFNYVPGPGDPWPRFTRVSTELEFDRQSLRLRRGKAELGGLGSGTFVLDEVEGHIADLGHDARLQIEGRGRGPADDALRYVKESPVGALVSHALDPTTASGAVELGLALDIPLQDAAHTQVKGRVLLANNNVQFRPDVPVLAEARARVDFDTTGFTVSAGAARVLGGNITFDGGQQRDGAIRFAAQGTASAEGMRRTPEWPALARLATQLAGQARYQLQLGFVHGQTELNVTSSLAGLAARLPAPLGKSEAQEMPLRLSVQPVQPAAPASPAAAATPLPREPQREWLRLELGSLLAAQYLRDLSGSGAPRVLRGAIHLGAPPEVLSGPSAAGPVVATITLPQLSVDAWTDWWQRHGDALTGTTTGATPAAASPANAEASPYLPGVIHLRTGNLLVGGQRLSGVDATLTQERTGEREAPAWRADVSADQLAGRIEVREPAGTQRPDRLVRARLARLAIPKDTPGETATAPARSPTDNPGRLPDLDVEVDDFQWQGKRLGRLEIQAANRGRGAGADTQEWHVSRLTLNSPEARLTASGDWSVPTNIGLAAARPGRRDRTALSFQLDLQDAGAWLERLGWAGTVRHGTGQINGDIGWFGSPLAFDLSSLSGQAHIGVDRGQFLRAEPGVARLLGVLSLQSLTRRLTLDFSDVFGDGFAFDRMDGDVNLAQGVASTSNLRIRGVQAAILTEGRADLTQETQDLHIWVIPDVNAGAASLLYAAINPAIGIGTLIGQLFLRKTLAEATTREFLVTGRWDAPQVTPVASQDRRPVPAAAASSSAPASGAASPVENGASQAPAAR